MPERMVSHWNAKGEADGYMPKFWGLFLMPLISLAMALLLLLIPKIDPLKGNIEKFRKYFDGFIIFILLFLFYLNVLVIIWNLGIRFNFIHKTVPAFSALFYYLGILVSNAKRNWFIGIRTPWTLSSETVWDKTHKIGGRLFKVSALIALIGILFGQFAVYFIILPVILTALYTCIYSYFEYKKENP
jgi:uncharacterized membrane protein